MDDFALELIRARPSISDRPSTVDSEREISCEYPALDELLSKSLVAVFG